MNLCRSCKYWSANAHAIGVGACINANVHAHILLGPAQVLMTSQDFGCVLHEQGSEDPSIYTVEDRLGIIREYYDSIHSQQLARRISGEEKPTITMPQYAVGYPTQNLP